MHEPEPGHADDGIIEVTLPLSQLLLDEANFRIEEVDDQQSAMEAMIRQQGEKKLYNLAEHIVKHERLAPGERLMVIPDDVSADGEGECFIVMEGNRRTTALKLLENPQLVKESFPRLYQQFVALAERTPRRLLLNVPCTVVPERAVALEWIAAKHSTAMEGVGVEKWDSPATARFAERLGRYRRFRIVLKRLEAANVDTTTIQQGIRKKTTAVDRVLGHRDVRDALGLVFREKDGTVDFENGDEEAGLNLLQRLMEAMAEPDFKTPSVHALEDRTEFVHSFIPFSVKRVEEESDDEEQPTAADSRNSHDTKEDGRKDLKRPGENSSKQHSEENSQGEGKGHPRVRGRNPLRRLTDRKTLAPTKREQTFHVRDGVLNTVYRELRDLRVKGFERAAGVMIRVFIELSCDVFLEDCKVPLPDNFIRRGTKRWSDAKLKEKVQAVLQAIDPNNQNDALDHARKALGADDWLHSIGTLHEFVHYRLASITEQEVKTIWDRWHPFFEGLHDHLSKT